MTDVAQALVATIVEWSELGKTVAASFLAGVGVTAAFAIAIFGAAQFSERRRSDEAVAAFGAALIAALGLAVCAGAIVFGLIVMLSD